MEKQIKFELETFCLNQGETFKVIAGAGAEPVHMIAFNKDSISETLSSPRTFQKLENVFLTQGDVLFSNKGAKMMEIVEDTAGEHDFLLPCPFDFKEFYASYGMRTPSFVSCFNMFAKVEVCGESGGLNILRSNIERGDHIQFKACCDLVIGLAGQEISLEKSERAGFPHLYPDFVQ